MKNEKSKAEFIGAQIKVAREEAKKSQLELAKALNFESSTAISLIESGERNITVENLENIAKILHRDIKFFLGEDDNKTIDIKVALRADKTMTNDDKEALLHFIEMAKKRHGGKN